MKEIDHPLILSVLENIQSLDSDIEDNKIIIIRKIQDQLEISEKDVELFLSGYKCKYFSHPQSWSYCCHLFYILLNIIQKIDLNIQNEEVISESGINSILHAVQECSTNGLELCVKKQQNRITYNATTQTNEEYQLLASCVRMFSHLFDIRVINSNSLFDDIKLDYIIAVIAVISINREDANEFQEHLKNTSAQFPREMVFKFLMMMKGFSGLSKEFQTFVHRELMRSIRTENGFLMMCNNLLIKAEDSQNPLWQKCEMISKIMQAVVAVKSCRPFIVKDIFRTLDMSLKNQNCDVAGASVYVLKKFSEMQDNELVNLIQQCIQKPLEVLINPDILICGAIVMEFEELKSVIDRLQLLFSNSTIAALPSTLLKDLLSILFQLYAMMPELPEKEKLASTILFFLSNRGAIELQEVMQRLRLKDGDSELKIHSRVIVKNTPTGCQIQIGNENVTFDDTEAFLKLLKESNNNPFIYKVFLGLFNIFGQIQESKDSFLSGYDVEEDELPEVLHKMFFKKLAILEPLQEMVSWKFLHSQFNENSKELLDVIRKILENSVENRSNAGSFDDQTTIIFFSIYRELINKLKNAEQRAEMQKEILKIKDKCRSEQMRKQIDLIFNLKQEEIPSMDPSLMAFEDAMKLLRSSEIYCKVYGSDLLIKLLKKRDPQALVNRHTILAVALQNLKETESYAYLNVIRLLVVLTQFMDSEVIDALMVEYKNQELEIDERLKVGEVILKVTEDLGETSIKFKTSLVHCFLLGSRDTNQEFRTSSLVNLGTICRILSYQIHNFFQEMFLQLESIVKCDVYLPSKRAAAMVLSQILAGLPNLMEFQDYLLPIYRLLKEILANESDAQTRIHAEIGLDHLKTKTKDFLNPKLLVEKEIKISLDSNPNKLNEIKFK
ncbi:unnamed protein product [Diamesa serratosioi]